MKTIHTPHRRTLAVLVPTLLLAAPALAQQVQTTTTPPPAVSASSQQSMPEATQAPTIVQGPSVPVVQAIPDTTKQPASDDTAVRGSTAARSATASRAAPTRSAPARAATARTTAPAAQPASAPVAKTATAPAAQTPAPAANTPTAAPAADTAPAAQTAPATTADSTQTQTVSAAPVWPWIAAGIVGLLAIIGLVALARRRREPRYEEAYVEPQVAAEPAYVEPVIASEPEPVIAAAPIAAAPAYEEPKYVRPEPVAEAMREEPVGTLDEAPVATADSAEIVSADAADVDALTAGDPPVADRPWLEMAMRPVRAGTSAEDALVEIELTVGNAGSVAAKDVRISTFLFAGEPDNAEMERLLVERDAEAVPPVTIAAGEGTTVEATLSLPRDVLDGEISPVIVADARYPLPGGGEGHTSASFRVGIAQEDGSITPIQIGKPHMTQTVDAELYGTPERV